MKILYLTQLVPYPVDAGAKVRMYHVLQYMHAAGHEVTLVCFRRSSDDDAALAQLRTLCHAVHAVPMVRSSLRDIWHLGRSVLRKQPFLIARDSVKAMTQLVGDLVQQTPFDVIQADQLWMAQYALSASAQLNGRAAQTRLVLDQHNAMFLIPERLAVRETSAAKRMILRREARVMQGYELETCAQFDHVVWVTDADRESFTVKAQGLTIPICVDTVEQTEIVPIRPNRITFLGGLHWPPNEEGVAWFVQEVWPQIYAACPNVILTIVGKHPANGLGFSGDRIEVTGYVDTLQPYLEETAVFVVPLHSGGGMRVKIIDAWAWGLPVVSTTIGAEGLDYTDGDDLIVADDSAEFAQSTIAVLTDPELNQKLRKNGRQTVEKKYDWRQIYPAWEDVYSG